MKSSSEVVSMALNNASSACSVVPMLLISDSKLQQTTQNDMLLLLLSDISDSSAISVIAHRYGVGLRTLSTVSCTKRRGMVVLAQNHYKKRWTCSENH
ncbi:hypothetical protein OUZ56_033563 [Daphnia magna]|uniref:Uncharacterized protein n=1 Tax=Daphnia magna TaxID=35525 RepID=A0ABR0BAU1_9CRUS|nr:hypothetical protein OUZ56_033563 [Daphnia magna]